MLEAWQPLLAMLERLTGTTSYYVNFIVTFLVAIALPVGLLTLAAWGGHRLNKRSLAINFALFGYAIIPLDIAAHIAHNLFHLLAEGKAVGFTALLLIGRGVPETSTNLVAIGIGASLYAVYRIALREDGYCGYTRLSIIPYAGMILMLGALNFYLFFLPMAMRM